MTKDDVREAQMLLNGHGFGPLITDGELGPKTTRAIMAFQQSKGLRADGIVGEKTKLALRDAKGAPVPTASEPSGASEPAPVAQPKASGLTLTMPMLHRITPKADTELSEAVVGNVALIYAAGIDTKLRLAHFIAQIATETGGLNSISESLNYSVDGLLKTFGRHRITEADAKKLGRSGSRAADQKGIANKVYGGAFGRKQLGNTEDGDGWRYRGGGYLQNTGRANYAKAGFEDNPEALRDPLNGLKAALEFWKRNKINKAADADDVVSVRKIINGGTNGLDEARAYLVKAKSAIF